MVERFSDKEEVEGSIPSVPTMAEYITSEGLEKLKKELNYLKTVKIKEIADLIKHTASFGDLKENAAYTDAKERQAFLQGKILELQDRVNSAKIVENRQTGKVQVGSKVLISLDEKEEKIEIVGPGEVDSLNGKISYESPLGKAVLDKSVGDKMEVKIGDNNIKCKILKIE